MTRAAVVAQALDRCLVLGGTGEQRGHDVAVVGRVLRPDHDDVAVEDAGADHGIARDAEREVVGVARRRTRGAR